MQRFLPAFALVLLVGCGVPKLNEERKFDVDSAGVTYDLPAVKVEQKVTVDAASTNEPVDVYLFFSKNKASLEKDIVARKLDSVLASKENQKDVSLQATIPPNEAWSVMVKATALKKATGTIKIKNH